MYKGIPFPVQHSTWHVPWTTIQLDDIISSFLSQAFVPTAAVLKSDGYRYHHELGKRRRDYEFHGKSSCEMLDPPVRCDKSHQAAASGS